ncbi:N-acetylneuraminate synthase [Pyruvatibacter sp.]|uniref:N-acetylneuraminate synthase n=1 Tax=Pyruvatibacter sp. TaxID=1981328 RepID=UPI003263C88F
MSQHVTVIAEAGVNHNGSLETALALVDAAAVAGADIVKFQTFKADALAAASAPKAVYQARETGSEQSQLDMLRALELPADHHHELARACETTGIEFLSTAFDTESLKFLVGEMGIKRIKIPSGELTNAPLVLEAARSGLPMILSTGMATLGDVEAALGVVAFGMTGGNEAPCAAAFEAAYASQQGRDALWDRVTVLHCTTDYPTPPEAVNMNAMATMGRALGVQTGYSDHTAGLAIPVLAVGQGAMLIEKHFTLDRGMPGPDHKASLEPDDLASMIAMIREAQVALGSSVKAPGEAERKNIIVARKSLVAAQPIAAGDVFTEDNLTVKRPGNGRAPMDFWALLGTPAGRAYDIDEAVE